MTNGHISFHSTVWDEEIDHNLPKLLNIFCMVQRIWNNDLLTFNVNTYAVDLFFFFLTKVKVCKTKDEEKSNLAAYFRLSAKSKQARKKWFLWSWMLEHKWSSSLELPYAECSHNTTFHRRYLSWTRLIKNMVECWNIKIGSSGRFPPPPICRNSKERNIIQRKLCAEHDSELSMADFGKNQSYLLVWVTGGGVNLS